jgi:hypothetical protein
MSPRLAFDFLRGALDAHLYPQHPGTPRSRLRRSVGLAFLAALLVFGGYFAHHPETASRIGTLGTSLRSPHLAATATPGEHGYGQRGSRLE